MFNRSKNSQKRNSNLGYWLNSDEAKEILLPNGYVPISKNEEVLKCVDKIADLVSSMTIMLMENGEGGDKRLKNELSKKIDVYPSKMMTRKNFIYKIVKDMLISGNSVVFPKFKEGLIDNLVIGNIDNVSFRGDEEDYSITYKGRKYDSDEILHFVLVPDDEEPFRGIGYTNIVKETVETLVQANVTKKAFLQSKWKPSIIIQVNGEAEELQDPEKRENILKSYVKDTEAGAPWIIPADEIDLKEVRPLTLNDLAIQDSITLDKKAIASAFGVPSFMVGVGDFKKEEFNNFISSKIMAIAKIIEQELSKKLVFKPSWYFRLNPRTLMQYDLSEMTSHVKDMVASGMLNRNEGRNSFDYSPVEGLDEYVVLENYIPVEDVGNQKKLDNKQVTDISNDPKGGDE